MPPPPRLCKVHVRGDPGWWSSFLLHHLSLWLGYSACKLAFGHTKHVGRPSSLGPSARPILTWPASLASGGYVRPFGSNKSFILLKPTRLLDNFLLKAQRPPFPPHSWLLQTLHKFGGGALLKNVQKILKGGPLLFFANFWGGSPPQKSAKFACLVFFFFLRWTI